MAISKKGLRKINVNNHIYYWKFNGKILIYPEKNKNDLLIIDFGWYDIWDYIHDNENKPADFEPLIATPKFVSESIEFALKSGWNNGKIEIKYRNKKYIIEK